MLDPAVTETGVGVARSERTGDYYGVQMFGRPTTEMMEFQIELVVSFAILPNLL